jgi:hypothetical protein
MAFCSIRRVIAEHLESEITKIPRFHSWQVRGNTGSPWLITLSHPARTVEQVFQLTNDIDGMKVIRVAVYLKVKPLTPRGQL